MVKATIPIAAGNKLVKGNMEATFNKVMADVRPEQTYFGVENGQRTIYMVVELKDPADMTRVAEPLWLALEADVETVPVMTADEFAKAGPGMGAIISKY